MHTVFVLMVVFFVRCEGLDGVVGPRMSPRLGNWMQRSTLRDRMSWRFARVVLVLPTFAETPNSLCDDRLDGLAAIPAEHLLYEFWLHSPTRQICQSWAPSFSS